MALTELKWNVSSGFLQEALEEGGSVPLLFPALKGHPHSLAVAPFHPEIQQQLVQQFSYDIALTLTLLPPSFHLGTPVITLGPPR